MDIFMLCTARDLHNDFQRNSANKIYDAHLIESPSMHVMDEQKKRRTEQLLKIQQEGMKMCESFSQQWQLQRNCLRLVFRGRWLISLRLIIANIIYTIYTLNGQERETISSCSQCNRS